MTRVPYLTLGAVARHFGCTTWQIRRLFERGLLPQAERFGAYRVVADVDLPRIKEALVQAGYLRPVSGESIPVE